MAWFSGATEGLPDEAVARKLLSEAGHDIKLIRNCGGKSKLDPKIPGYNQAAKHGYWFILRDLDHDAGCAPELRTQLLPMSSAKMQLRIVVRSIEAWLIGDYQRFAHFFGVPQAKIPRAPETLDNPKQTVLNLVQGSRKRDIRSDMLPRADSRASEGPAYASRLAEFAETEWRPHCAAAVCQSLGKCLTRLAEIG